MCDLFQQTELLLQCCSFTPHQLLYYLVLFAVAAADDGGDSSDHLRYAVPKYNYTHLIILDNACN